MSLGLNKQTLNEVRIEGLISEIKFREGSASSTGDFIAGEIIVEVEQENNGMVETNLIPVSTFASKLKKDGNPNPAYKGLKEIEETYNSVASAGRDKADKIRASKGAELGENSFYNDKGELISSIRVRNTFFNRVNADYSPQALFTTKIVILSIKDEMDRDGVETGRLIIQGGLVQWGGRIDVVPFVVESKEAVAYIRQNYQKNQTVQISGKIRFISTTKTNKIEQAFGEDLVDEKTFTKREFIVTSGSSADFDEDESYDIDAVAKGLEERKARLQEAAEKSKNNKQAPAGKAPDTGF